MNFGDSDDEDEDVQPNLTPLVDVVFQLLIFFVITMTYAAQREYLLPIELAKATAGDQDQDNTFKGATITVLEDGQVVIDGEQPVSPEELREKMEALVARNPQAQIVVRGDERASHGSIIVVLDLVTSLGFGSVDLVVTKPQ